MIMISDIKRDIVCFHTPFFSYTTAFDAPIRGFLSEYVHDIWCRKIRKVELPDGEKSLRIHSAISTQYQRVTDRRTDKRTDILQRHSPVKM